jgi:hypothetical protein
MKLGIGTAIGSQHRRNGLATRLGHRDSWNSLNNARFLHERRIELGRNAADYSTVIAWETRIWWIGGCSTPEVIRGVGQEVNFSFVEERGFAAIALRKNDFVKKFDRGVIHSLALTLVDEFVEPCLELAK